MQAPLLDVEQPTEVEYAELLPVQKKSRGCVSRPVLAAVGIVSLLGVALAVATVGGASTGFGGTGMINQLLSFFGFVETAPASASFAGFPGTGLNLATGAGKLPYVALDKDTHACVVDGDQTIDVSNSIDCKPLRGKTFPKRKSYVFNSYKDYDSQVNRWRSEGNGVGGFFVWTDDVRQVYRDYFAADLAVVIVQQEHAFVELSLNQAVADRKLSARAAAAVEALSQKETITDEDKEEFIRNFGTSYITFVQMGGLVELRVFVKKSIFSSMSSEEVSVQAQKDFERELKIDTSHVLDKVYVDSRVGQSSMLWGGRPDLSGDERTLKNWLKTVPENPAALEFESAEMDPIVTTEEKSAVVGVVNNYLDTWSECRERGCLSHGVCNEGGKCVCDNPFSGESCEVIAKSRGQFVAADLAVASPYPDPKSWIVADVNGDKLDDLVAFATDHLIVHLALGDNRFKTFNSAVSPMMSNGHQMWRVDVNKDGLDDIVGLSSQTKKILTYISKGDGTFKAVDSGAPPLDFGNADFCHTTRSIPALVAYKDGKLNSYIPSGDDNAKWTIVQQSVPRGSPAHSGDFNGDGFTDMMSVHNQAKTSLIQIYFGMGNGTYTKAESPAPSGGINFGASRKSLVVMDVNGDGKDDFVSVTSSPVEGVNQRTFTTFMSNGDGTFDMVMQVYDAQSSGYNFNIEECVEGDLDNDKHTDIICAGNNVSGTRPLLIGYSRGDGHYDFMTYVDKLWTADGSRLRSFMEKYMMVGLFNGPTNAHGLMTVPSNQKLHGLL